MAYETMVFAEPEIETAEEPTGATADDFNDESDESSGLVQEESQSPAQKSGTVQPQPAAAPPPGKPGFLQRLGKSLGLPTSRAELEEMQRREEALPWYKRIIPHAPGTDPNVATTLLLGPGGEMLRQMAGDYGQTAV
ncbi:MAG: hypothetical protein LAP21_09530, partial [Acidobacteriia bacterium]|nr:hypothetical protein [Terriglobia bacterium]